VLYWKIIMNFCPFELRHMTNWKKMTPFLFCLIFISLFVVSSRGVQSIVGAALIGLAILFLILHSFGQKIFVKKNNKWEKYLCTDLYYIKGERRDTLRLDDIVIFEFTITHRIDTFTEKKKMFKAVLRLHHFHWLSVDQNSLWMMHIDGWVLLYNSFGLR
jgi:hypothetical protein